MANLVGQRPGATTLPLQISDQVSGSIDVGTGNLLLNVNALSLPGIDGSFNLGLAYNSTVAVNPFMGNAGRRLAWSLGSAGTLTTSQGNMFFNGPDGGISKFTPVSGSSTAYTSPSGVLADLVKTDSGWTLTSRVTAKVARFNSDGLPFQVADRNGNNTVITWNAINKPAKVVSTRGSSGANTATMTYDSAGIFSGISQTSGGITKATSFTFDFQRNITSFTDMAGKTTLFSYINNEYLSTITSPTGALTTLTLDSDGRVTQVEKSNTSTGSPGNSITRLSYPSNTQTLVAGPNTNPAVAVAAGPRTTYTLNADKRVTAVTDPMGRAQAKTYTGDFATLTATRGTGTTSGTTTNTYGANSGQSLTQSQAPDGAKNQVAYTNTAAATKYLPTSATSDAGNQSLFTYNGAGNALTSSDALAATATLTYNTDGTVATALAPGNGANKTLYGYNASHELTTITPVTGSSLTASTYTYDAWGRPRTITTDGKTATYTYDAIGRATQTTFSDYTPTITYTYNDDGQLTTRVDGSGTTSYGYDQMGRLTNRANTAGGGTITYGYDKASNLTSTTDTRGTTSYSYDSSGKPTALIYLLDGVAKTLAFANDDQGRRTDTWLESNPARTTWKARTHTDYDTTGRVSRVTAAEGTGDASNTPVMDLSYCYAAGTTAPNCTSTAANDRKNIQWVKNNLTGDVTTYTYDAANRLTKAAIAGCVSAS